jgi:cytochrome c oxidase assembly protein subunit 15
MTSLANTSAPGLVRNLDVPAGISAVCLWLFIVAGFIFAMVLVGGATRLTGSGLSITEWQPILGILPPSSEGAWQEAFEKYRQIPEYELVNRGMSLGAFKTIYWWEWTHRFIGRLIGFVFLIPFVYFLARRSIPKAFIPRVAALFVLGGAQGALGWFMVKSGLSDRVDVSQYRLAAHLALAVAIAGYAFWLGLSIREQSRPAREGNPLRASSPGVRLCAGLLAALVYLQIIAGAFVAGLKAGHASNTWPLMNGEVLPPGLDAISPWYLNFFENPLTAQFTHRVLAYAIAIFAIGFGALIWRFPNTRPLRLPIVALLCAIMLQIALGVVTILYGVPIDAALAHQANAIAVLALALWMLHRAVGPESYSAARA